jgi:DnaJ-domain-containing protein 1
MTNFFAVFGLPPRPMIDVALLSDLYANKSKTAHPDRAPDGDFATLNEAFRTLSDPVSRVWHLLAISGGEPQSVTASAEINGWFGQVASGLQRFDQLLRPLSQETSSLLRAVKIREVEPAAAELDKLSGELTRQKERLLKAMGQIDSRWSENLAVDRASLAQIACDLRFIEKWLAQIAERRLRLASIAP